MNTVSAVLDLVRRKRQQNRAAIGENLREVIERFATAQLAGEPIKLSEHEADVVEALLDAENLSDDDLQANVAARVAFAKASEEVSRLPQLQAAAKRAGQAAKQFAQQIWTQHNENLKRVRELEVAAAEASTRAARVVTIESNLLAQVAAHPPSDEEREIAAQRGELLTQIGEIDEALRESREWSDVGCASSLAVHPKLYVKQAEAELAQRTRGQVTTDTTARIAVLKKGIAAAESAIAKLEKERSQLQKQLAALDQRASELLVKRPFKIIHSQNRQTANV